MLDADQLYEVIQMIQQVINSRVLRPNRPNQPADTDHAAPRGQRLHSPHPSYFGRSD